MARVFGECPSDEYLAKEQEMHEKLDEYAQKRFPELISQGLSEDDAQAQVRDEFLAANTDERGHWK